MPFPDLNPDPDFERLEKVFARGLPDRVPFIELFLDEPVMEAIREAPFSADSTARWKEMADLFYRLGYDYVPCRTEFALPYTSLEAEDTAALSSGTRGWVDENRGAIETWDDFEQYPWPTVEERHYRPLAHATAALPEGMKLLPHGPGGVLENVMWLMGYSPMCYAIADQPDLVRAMFDRVGELLLGIFDTLAGHEGVGAVFLGDDMGFKTQTMISPEALRQWVFPWQRRLAEAVHAHGKPFLLHSCGNLESVMEDLIEDVGIDAKHSFEDVIMPIEEVKRRWGSRLALLGGIDMDLLCRGTPDQVRHRTAEVIEACMPGGGFAVGSGNTVANYVPLENYFAMLEETRRVGV